jgi:hypothetical protein
MLHVQTYLDRVAASNGMTGTILQAAGDQRRGMRERCEVLRWVQPAAGPFVRTPSVPVVHEQPTTSGV